VADNKNTIILVLVFACGLLAGCVLYGLLAPQPIHPEKLVVFTERAPNPIGPYSQAVLSGNFVFTSGQIGIDPATGNLSATTEEQTVRTMENLHAILQQSGLEFGDVVQTRIYLTNMSDWTTVNGCYGSYFKDGYSARMTV